MKANPAESILELWLDDSRSLRCVVVVGVAVVGVGGAEYGIPSWTGGRARGKL